MKLIKFPKGEFTISDMEKANSQYFVSDVRLRLAEAIANGQVEVITKREINGQAHESYAYRERPQ
jgi:hypothetical protein